MGHGGATDAVRLRIFLITHRNTRPSTAGFYLQHLFHRITCQTGVKIAVNHPESFITKTLPFPPSVTKVFSRALRARTRAIYSVIPRAQFSAVFVGDT